MTGYPARVLVGIDHLVIAVPDPDAAAHELERAVGLRASGGGRHESLGTFNRLVWLGDTYLELIGVWDEALAAASWVGAPTVAALAAGGGLATYALASDDLVGDVERLRAGGAAWAGPLPGERTRRDGRVVRWSIAAPPRLGPDEPPFLIEHDTTGAEWTPAERAARAAEVHPLGAVAELEALELSVTDVRAVQDRYLRALGRTFRPSLAGNGARDMTIGRQTIRLRPRRGHPDGPPGGSMSGGSSPGGSSSAGASSAGASSGGSISGSSSSGGFTIGGASPGTPASEPSVVRLAAAGGVPCDVTVLGLRFVVRA